jgi:diguanylate cyclase (GGDEF)-like protein
MRKHLQERDDAVRALQQAKDELEVRIDERTAELSRTSQELQTSLEVLEKTHNEDSMIAELVDLLQSCRTTKESVDILQLFGRKLFPNDCGAVYSYRASRNLLELAVAWGPHQPEPMLDPEHCWALRRGRQHLVLPTDVSLQCRHLEGASTHSLCIPMMAQGEATGVLMLRAGASESQASLISRDALRIAPIVAGQIALALSNLDLREKLRDQAIRDPLTGLFNRRYFEETAERELHRAECRDAGAAIILIDIDYFKRFNDTYGHDAGDAVLKKFAMLLQTKARVEDIACRHGGEEFVLLLSGVPLAVAISRAEQLREAVKDLEMRYRGDTLGTISISCGVAAFSDHGRSLSELMAVADRVLYKAKHEGRDRVVAAFAPNDSIEEPAATTRAI